MVLPRAHCTSDLCINEAYIDYEYYIVIVEVTFILTMTINVTFLVQKKRCIVDTLRDRECFSVEASHLSFDIPYLIEKVLLPDVSILTSFLQVRIEVNSRRRHKEHDNVGAND